MPGWYLGLLLLLVLLITCSAQHSQGSLLGLEVCRDIAGNVGGMSHRHMLGVENCFVCL